MDNSNKMTMGMDRDERRERVTGRAGRGQSLTELALVLPVIIAILIGIVELGSAGSTPRNRGHAATSVGGALARLRRAAHARPTSSV